MEIHPRALQNRLWRLVAHERVKMLEMLRATVGIVDVNSQEISVHVCCSQLCEFKGKEAYQNRI